jgi:hypothetical protein
MGASGEHNLPDLCSGPLTVAAIGRQSTGVGYARRSEVESPKWLAKIFALLSPRPCHFRLGSYHVLSSDECCKQMKMGAMTLLSSSTTDRCGERRSQKGGSHGEGRCSRRQMAREIAGVETSAGRHAGVDGHRHPGVPERPVQSITPATTTTRQQMPSVVVVSRQRSVNQSAPKSASRSSRPTRPCAPRGGRSATRPPRPYVPGAPGRPRSPRTYVAFGLPNSLPRQGPMN